MELIITYDFNLIDKKTLSDLALEILSKIDSFKSKFSEKQLFYSEFKNKIHILKIKFITYKILSYGPLSFFNSLEKKLIVNINKIKQNILFEITIKQLKIELVNHVFFRYKLKENRYEIFKRNTRF